MPAMNPGTFALLSRTLRRDVTLWQPHVFRAGFAGMVLFALFFAHSSSLMFGAPGLQFFRSILGLNFMVISLAGIGLFSSVITEEKEDASLGLLRMAGISHLGLMLGKSTGLLLSALALLVVQFPFTLLAITLGGVTLGQAVAAYVALAAYLVLVANAGLFCSTVCRRTGPAVVMMGLLIGTLVLLPVLLHRSLAAWAAGGGLSGAARFVVATVAALNEASVVRRIVTITQTGFAESAVSVQVASNLAAAAGFFLLAWATFDYFTRGENPSAPLRNLLLRQTGGLVRLGAGHNASATRTAATIVP
jgi:ABC-type transport system involved in multi-copper enzyme maturation permease subunit